MSDSPTTPTNRPNNATSESEVNATSSPEIRQSNISRKGGFTGTPDAIAVDIVFIPEYNTEEIEGTVLFSVDDHNVAHLDDVETDRQVTKAQEFIPVAFAAREITHLNSVEQVEGVPRLSFIQEYLFEGEATVGGTPASGPKHQSQSEMQGDVDVSVRTTADGGGAATTASDTASQSAGQSSSDAKSPSEPAETGTGGDSGPVSPATEQQMGGNQESSQSEATNEPAQPSPPSATDTESGEITNEREAAELETQPRPNQTPTERALNEVANEGRDPDAEGWELREANKEGVIGQTIVNQSSGDSIAMWDISDRGSAEDFAVIYYPTDGSEVQEVCEDTDRAIQQIRDWVLEPPNSG